MFSKFKGSSYIALVLGSLMPLGALASQGIRCEDARAGGLRRFEADFLIRQDESGRELYALENARLVDQFRSAKLACVGRHLGQIGCLGYWHGTGDGIVEVRLRNTQQGLLATLEAIRGEFPADQETWSCWITPHDGVGRVGGTGG
jgi:hypothetical protein